MNGAQTHGGLAPACLSDTRPAEACGVDPPGPLTPREKRLLNQLEKEIDRDLRAFVRVGQALKRICDERLYRATHATFEAYVSERWPFERQYAYRTIRAAEVVSALSPIGDKGMPLPETESQARELAKVEPGDLPGLWEEIVRGAPKDADGRPRITAAYIRDQVRRDNTPGDELDEQDEERKGRRRPPSADSGRWPATAHDLIRLAPDDLVDVLHLDVKAYEAYRRQSGGKSLATGTPLPPWARVGAEIAAAWRAATAEVVGSLLRRLGVRR